MNGLIQVLSILSLVFILLFFIFHYYLKKEDVKDEILIQDVVHSDIDKIYDFIADTLYERIENKEVVLRYLELIFDENNILDKEYIKDTIDLNPLLIIVLMDLESSFRQTVIGDNGKAMGYFQLHKICLEDVSRYNDQLKELYENYFKNNFEHLLKHPIRQLEYALSYLQYYYKVGGVDRMIHNWNYTDNFKIKLIDFYDKWYREFVNYVID